MAKATKKRKPGNSPKSAKLGVQPEVVNIEDLPKESDPGLRMLWFDRIKLQVRGDQPVGLMRFYAVVGDEKVTEVARLLTSHAHLKNIADVLCKTLNHYPTKPS